MLRFLADRLLAAIPTLLLITIIVFGLQQLLPGDVALILAGDERDPAAIEEIRELYGLNDPLPIQYFRWFADMLQGDFGRSLRTGAPVGPMILEKLPITLQLAALALVFSIVIGIPTGIISAIRKGSALDYGANIVALSGISLPSFWLGIMLILLFSVQLDWLPAGGYVSPLEDLGGNLARMVMPAFVLGTALAASMMRHTRSAMLSVMRQDYVRTARAKGLSERTVILKHALRNALVPIITLTALQFGTLVAGAVLTEQVFNIPGFGKLIVDAVFNRDYPVVQAVTLATGVGFVLMSLLADIGYFLVSPKLRG
ncbi:MAG: ABC transporter permease [Pseudomonadota bacterium]